MIYRYPDNEAGEVPMAFVVRQPQSSLGVAQVIDFVAKQVFFPSNFQSYVVSQIFYNKKKNIL